MTNTDWYAELAAGWAERQRIEDEKWCIPDGALFVTVCGRWVDGAGRACPQGIGHAGTCGLPAEDGPSCKRGCPDGECFCPLPGDPAINPACGDTRAEQCPDCMCCRVCVGCHCYE